MDFQGVDCLKSFNPAENTLIGWNWFIVALNISIDYCPFDAFRASRYCRIRTDRDRLTAVHTRLMSPDSFILTVHNSPVRKGGYRERSGYGERDSAALFRHLFRPVPLRRYRIEAAGS